MTKISYFGKQNLTLGSVVPLAMFSIPTPKRIQSQKKKLLIITILCVLKLPKNIVRCVKR